MAPDRNEMARLHEEFLAELNGGRKSRASGSTWKDQADGRGNSLTDRFAFAWDGKSTRGLSIAVSREMITKIREQAAGERPMIGLRFYGSDDLRQVDEDWVAVPAADWAEVLAAARMANDYAQTNEQPVYTLPPSGLEDWLPDPEGIRERQGKWTAPDPPRPLHGDYPADLPPPPYQMWPCLVVDSRGVPGDVVTAGPRESRGYWIAADGRVTDYGVSSVRYDRGMGYVRLYVNDLVVRSGRLYVDGALRVTVGDWPNRLAAQ